MAKNPRKPIDPTKTDYPLCWKYKFPVVNGQVPDRELREAIRNLPNDWDKQFYSVMGCVTCILGGFYAVDVEDTLWALEKGKESRRWNG